MLLDGKHQSLSIKLSITAHRHQEGDGNITALISFDGNRCNVNAAAVGKRSVQAFANRHISTDLHKFCDATPRA